MSATRKLLAIDLGAESGRGLLGLFDGSRLELKEVHRFPNGGVRLLDALHWDAPGLWRDVQTALRRCAADHGGCDSVGVDTWGVDFGLLGRDGGLLGNPRHHRDPHTEGVPEAAFNVMPRAELYRRTGLQFLRFNSLFQLLAMKRDNSPLLGAAEQMLLVPDLLHYWMTGEAANELTNASTTQMLDPHTRDWARDVVEAFGLPTKFLGRLVPPGTVLGTLRASVSSETGAGAVPVVVPGTHDTASAVAAVPAESADVAYISSGTWSLMGVELDAPLVTPEALADNFTNEGGVGGTVRFLKNIMGLWLIQECRRAWQRAGRDYGYDELAHLAAVAKPFVSLVDPDHPSFLLPANMPEAVGDFCRRTGQPVPTEPGPVVRCLVESLAMKYRWALDRLERLTGKRLNAVHVVGGGCQNALLCQLTADACDRPVLAGPVEATAVGNVLVQALGLGLLGSMADVRQVVRDSFRPAVYEPRHPDRWNAQWERFAALLPAG